MKYLIGCLSFIALAFMSFINAPKKIKVVFFGDSITQGGVGPKGYIVKLDSIIKQQGLADNYELLGAGVSGNKVYDLYLRIEADVLDKNPDVVIIYVGVNDVWHKATSGTGTDPDKFEKFYRAIIKKLQDKNIKVIVCTPATIGEKIDNSNQQDGDLNYYSNMIRKIGKEANLSICDLRLDFNTYLLKNNPNNLQRGVLTGDGVHPNETGSIFLANEMWKAIQTLNK